MLCHDSWKKENNVNLVNYVGTVTGVTNSSVIINQNIYNNSTQSYFQNYVNGDQINILDDTNKLPWVINGVSGYWTYCPGSNTPVFIESACGCFIVFPCSAPDTCQPAQATCPESPDQSTIPQPIPTPAPTQDNSQNNTVITTGLPSPAPEPWVPLPFIIFFLWCQRQKFFLERDWQRLPILDRQVLLPRK